MKQNRPEERSSLLRDEYDIVINVTYHGVAVQISDRATDAIVYEQNDLDDIHEAIDCVLRVTAHPD